MLVNGGCFLAKAAIGASKVVVSVMTLSAVVVWLEHLSGKSAQDHSRN
jgi:hypothetical protein